MLHTGARPAGVQAGAYHLSTRELSAKQQRAKDRRGEDLGLVAHHVGRCVEVAERIVQEVVLDGVQQRRHCDLGHL